MYHKCRRLTTNTGELEWMTWDVMNIILDNNYKDELAYVFNVYKDDTDPMQVQTEAFSMSTMFQGSNCKNYSDILEHLELYTRLNVH